jgi:hypothetical protein
MNTQYNQYNEVLDYFIREGYQEACISITSNEPTDADLNWLAYNGNYTGSQNVTRIFCYNPIRQIGHEVKTDYVENHRLDPGRHSGNRASCFRRRIRWGQIEHIGMVVSGQAVCALSSSPFVPEFRRH